MIVIDVRGFDKKVTLEKCNDLYDNVREMFSSIPMTLGYKGRIECYPDEIWINKWQAENIFSDPSENIWSTWRAVKVRVIDVPA